MPAKDKFHDVVRKALTKNGWTITHDPLRLRLGKQHLFADLGAEKLLSAEKGNQKIAVEVKSFLNPSIAVDLEQALGQYLFYGALIAENEPQRLLYLALPQETFTTFFSEEEIGEFMIRKFPLKLLIFEAAKEEIVQWIH